MRYLDQLFETQVGLSPDAVAVVFEESRLTYRELNWRADRLARQLRALGVGPDVLVALFLERSLDMVVGMLGVLKAGGAYVPLDPILPPRRLAHMLVDAQPLVLLTQGRLQSKLPPHGSHVVVIDAGVPPAEWLKQAPAPGRKRHPNDLAYVIYTSGSTGEPKGVEIEHRAAVNMLVSMQQRPGFGAVDTMLAITTLAFDIAVLEIFLPLARGACVIIAAAETVGDGMALIGLIERSGVSVMQATPATLRMLLDAGWAGAPRLKVLCGGEAWTAELARQLLPRCDSLWNMYGPTETTVWSAVAKVEAGRPIVIGPPIANTRFYVLDGAFQLVPVGVPGELHIGGDGLARGYLHRPELTRERFVIDPFAAEPGARMYRTGDLVRRLSDGTLEFLGRLDHQVKIRGHRIEPGEIEAVLERHPGIDRCVVVALEAAHGDHRLVAYIIPAAGSVIPASELRLLLGEQVPAYMIPSAFVAVASFPLTSSGKFDRKALPRPDVSAQEADVASLEPSTPTEEVLARIWCEMLDLKQVGTQDNFFNLGGHSLMLMRLVEKVKRRLNVNLGIAELFQNPTIEQMARRIDKQISTGEVFLRPIYPPGVVEIRAGTMNRPLFCLPGLGGLLGFHLLAAKMDTSRPILGLELHSLGVKLSVLRSMELLAEAVVQRMRQVQPVGPYTILGYSFGGTLGVEVARQLMAGQALESVIIIDSYVPGFLRRPKGLRKLAVHLRIIRRLNYSEIFAYFRSRIQSRLFPRTLPEDEIERRIFEASKNCLDAFRAHHPKVFPGRIALFKAGAIDDWLLVTDPSGTNGWGDICKDGVDIIPLACGHSDVFKEPNITALAGHISDLLNARIGPEATQRCSNF
jgi:amino acid adenylation domain-containing protein